MKQFEQRCNNIASRIRGRLTAVTEDLISLTSELTVNQLRQSPNDTVVFIGRSFYWDNPTPSQRFRQVQIKRDYEPIAELLGLLFHRAPDDLVSQFKEADKDFRSWIELESRYRLSTEPSNNELELRTDAAALEKLLDVFAVTGEMDTIIVPDTNSLLQQSDPTAYRAMVDSARLVFMLLPTVLGELDRLKISHRNPDVSKKAEAVVRRIKGWRNQGKQIQGNLTAGIKVEGSISVIASHIEPDMENTLSWLDPSVQDDRIIANVLALQSAKPAARIVLVSGDINLLNKADAALIETADTPIGLSVQG